MDHTASSRSSGSVPARSSRSRRASGIRRKLTGVGLGGAIGPALSVLVMIVAALGVHVRNGFLQSNNGFELNSVYIAIAIALGYVGPGELSVDHALHLDVLASTTQVTVPFAVAVVLALINVAFRRPTPS